MLLNANCSCCATCTNVKHQQLRIKHHFKAMRFTVKPTVGWTFDGLFFDFVTYTLWCWRKNTIGSGDWNRFIPARKQFANFKNYCFLITGTQKKQIKDLVGYSYSTSTEEVFHPPVSLHLNKFICVNLRNGWCFTRGIPARIWPKAQLALLKNK